ncbi:MAG: prepilin peptidase [Fibrobacterales bacterium]
MVEIAVNTISQPLVLLMLVIVAALSVALGSYFTVVIYRVPRGESLLTPGSHCPHCNTRLKWYHNVPLVSYLFLKGQCAFCGVSMGASYLWVEFLTGLLGVVAFYTGLLYWGVPSVWQAGAFTWLVLTLVPIVVVDVKYYLIPDGVVLPGVVVGVVLALVGDYIAITGALLGGCTVGLGFWLFGWVVSRILKKEALGFGDVKLLAMIGCFVGLDGAVATIVGASGVGLVVTLILKIVRGESREIPLPFGPYISVAALPVFVWKDQLIEGYFNIISQVLL